MDNALDIGIKEQDFWYMTIGEIERAFNSYLRAEKLKEQKQATFDYILADLIGQSVGRAFSTSNKMPTLMEAYPTVFDDDKKEEVAVAAQKKKDELSALRFKLFAQSFNKRFEEVAQTK